MIYVLIIFLIIFVICLIELIRSITVIKEEHVVITSEKIEKDMNIVFISDLHIGAYNKKKSFQKIINLVNQLDGDYLLIGGDMVGVRMLKHYSNEELKNLVNKFKIKNRYFVDGNHDQKDLLMYNNFKILNDEIVELGSNVYLIGLKWDKGESLNNQLNSDNFNILFSHYPDRIEEYPGVDLGLGAHSHGNQVNLPFCRFHHKEKYTRGLYILSDNKYLYVNRGLGFSLFKVRFFSTREIVKIELRSGKGGNN